MTRTADMLLLAQWLSPAFPLGGFAYSHGIEAAFADGQITDADTLRDWCGAVLAQGAGRNDLILLAAAWRGDDPEDLDTLARAFAAGAERVLEAEAQGHAFAHTVNAVWHLDVPAVCLPVAFGVAAARRSIPLDGAAPMFLQAFAHQLVSAAARLGVVGQIAAQGVLVALSGLFEGIVAEALAADTGDMGGAVPLADIAAMRHETLGPRIFRT